MKCNTLDGQNAHPMYNTTRHKNKHDEGRIHTKRNRAPQIQCKSIILVCAHRAHIALARVALGKLAGVGDQDLVITRIRRCCITSQSPIAGASACRGCALSPLWFEELCEGGRRWQTVRPAVEGRGEEGVLERRCTWLGRTCVWERGWRARLKERLE